MGVGRQRAGVCVFGFALAGGMAWAGCAGRLRPEQPPAEMRRSIAVANSEPRMLLVGPAKLLHVQTEKRKGQVILFRAPRQYGTDADCRVARAGDEVAFSAKGGAVDVTRDEVVCARVERKARLSWHALSTPDASEAPLLVHHASLP
jgi:hypothetical protein